MTTDVLKLPGDYQIITKSGGTLTLNVGGTSTNGTVVIDGNLAVLGVQTQIESINATIKDNILILNSGESNNNPNGQVSLGTSGIMVARGFNDASTAGAFLVYDDGVIFPGNYQGLWKFGYGNYFGRIIETAGIVAPLSANTLTFLGAYNPNAVLSVGGTTNYASNVKDPDHIPNKAYVDAVAGTSKTSQQLVVGGTTFTLHDSAVSTSSEYYSATPYITAALGTSSNVVFQLEGQVAQFSGLSLVDSKIQNIGTSTFIALDPGTNNTVQVQSALQLKNIASLSTTSNYTGLYSNSTVGGGGTGVYFVNTQQTDELVSRRRSIVYSIIF